MEALGFDYFIDASKRVYLPYMVSSFAIALIYLYFNPKLKRVNFSSKLWLHPSAKLDYSYFIINNLIKTFLIFPLVLSAKSVALSTSLFLIDNFGYLRVQLDYEMILILYTLTLFIFSDLTRYWLHRLLHTLPWLWEIHKVHHSAKVLTPMTFYRIHPIENILFGLRYALSIGLITGIFIYFFGAKLGIIEVLGVNILLFVFSAIGSNLRHSHIPLSYPKVIENLLISPKMHQIHHSTKFYNKNFGGYLALWDWMFGSLKTSKNVGSITFGIKKSEMMNYDSLLKLLLIPIINIIIKTKVKKKEDYEIFKVPCSRGTSYTNHWV